jgi:Protein of unknown function (DUF2865)
LKDRRSKRRVMLVAAVTMIGAFAPRAVSAEGLFDFLFGGAPKQQQRQTSQSNFFDPFGTQQPAPPPRQTASSSSGPAYCVRSCDGRYFPLSRGNANPVQMCQAFCPASPTKVFYGSAIDSASTTSGERYAESENAYAYRKALRADCTCNGRDSAGLAPVDLTLDSSLRTGDVIATTDGLVAYSGVRVGNGQTAEFTPVASFPGLTSEVRARLGEMKVAPVRAETIADDTPSIDTITTGSLPKSVSVRDKRAAAD